MQQINPLVQDQFDLTVLQILLHFQAEYKKYQSKDSSSAILKWFNSKNVNEHKIWNMKNQDIVIAGKGSSQSNINGPAVILYKDGTVYAGNLIEAQRHGFGYRTFAGSDLIYAGEYEKDLKSGKGRLFASKANKWVFEGLYSNDLRNGQGHLEKLDGCKYQGNYTNDRMNGHGNMIWGNGTHYIGGFKDDLKHGQGSIRWSNGDKYEGDFINSYIDGKGAYTWKNGEVFNGLFTKGQMSGQGIIDYSSVIPIKGNGNVVNGEKKLEYNVIQSVNQSGF